MNIDIVMPYKEIFSEKNASAVSLTIKNSCEFFFSIIFLQISNSDMSEFVRICPKNHQQ